MKVEIRRVSAPLRMRWRAAHGEIGQRELILLALEDDQGLVGLGEAGPLQGYDGVALGDVEAALRDCLEPLRTAERKARADVLGECARRAVLPQAVAAIDLALWDLAGQRAQKPVWRLLGGARAPAVEVNYTVAAADRAGAAEQATEARRQGYACLKVKVALGDDAGRLAAVRAAAGPEMAIRIDANGAWSVEEAHAALNALEPLGIELCEEPVRGVDEVARLAKRTRTPLALDETAAAPGALDRRLCTAVCLKVGRCGGITGMVRAASRARAAGYEVYLASTLDGPLGIAAAVHAAAAVAPDRPSGLATLGIFEARPDPMPPHRGRIHPPAGPGLGRGLTAWYEASSPRP